MAAIDGPRLTAKERRDAANAYILNKHKKDAVAPVTPAPPAPVQYDPAQYQQQLASQLSPGFQTPTPIQGQFPMQGQAPMVQQPGFGNGQFNPNMGLFGSFAPQGGMFSGLFGGQQ